MVIIIVPTSTCNMRIKGDDACRAFSIESAVYRSLIDQSYYCCSSFQKMLELNKNLKDYLV